VVSAGVAALVDVEGEGFFEGGGERDDPVLAAFAGIVVLTNRSGTVVSEGEVLLGSPGEGSERYGGQSK
jgi:hypothetical protein